jgi:hypothetical protein
MMRTYEPSASESLRRARRATLACVVGFVALAPFADARADESRFGPHDVRAVFVIGKNLDRNEVQYGIRLDDQCVPVSSEPIYAYWRQYEQGPEVTEDLNFLDKTAYGIRMQVVQSPPGKPKKIVMTLRATSDRGIAIVAHKLPPEESGGRGTACAAEALAFIANVPARLQRVYVHVAGFLSVDYIELTGTRLDNGKPIVERINH